MSEDFSTTKIFCLLRQLNLVRILRKILVETMRQKILFPIIIRNYCFTFFYSFHYFFKALYFIMNWKCSKKRGQIEFLSAVLRVKK